jgi:hypothetical protein
LPEQEIPEELNQQPGESLEVWRDRLYHTYRLPTILAAISDLKLSYIELINPLLSRKIIQTVRTLPDKLRTNKTLFKRIVNSICPRVPYALYGANAMARDILKTESIVEYLKCNMDSYEARNVFSGGFLSLIKQNIRSSNSSAVSKRSMIQGVKDILPRYVKNRIWDSYKKPILDYNVLSFRTLIIFKMVNALRFQAGNDSNSI